MCTDRYKYRGWHCKFVSRTKRKNAGKKIPALNISGIKTNKILKVPRALMRPSQKADQRATPHRSALDFRFCFFQFCEACAWLGGAKRRRLVSRQAHASVPNGTNYSIILEFFIKVWYTNRATQLNIFSSEVYVGKNVGFACHIFGRELCRNRSETAFFGA